MALACLPAILAAALAAASGTQQPKAPPQEPESWRVEWRHGTRITSPDGEIEITIAGRTQLDALADVDGEGRLAGSETSSEFRRARLSVQGSFHDRYLFKSEFDFATGDEPVRDLYVGLDGLGPAGTLIVGHFKEPFSFDDQTSSRFLTFPERPIAVDAFVPGRNLGVLLYGRGVDDRVTWKAGLFQTTDADLTVRDGGRLHFTTRVTGIPWRSDEGDRLLHFGAAFSRRNPADDRIDFGTRPEAHLVDEIVSTPALVSDETSLYGLEAALVVDAFHAQAEVIEADVSSGPLDDPSFGGWYAQVGYFLTGERRPYTTSGATGGGFDRVRPKRPIGRSWDLGAWEVGVRYATVDLDASGVAGGSAETWSATLNWYLSSWARTFLTYVDAERDLEPGRDRSSARAVMLRLSIDF